MRAGLKERPACCTWREVSETDQIIIHVDMDAFYASVEMRDNPSLRGKPLIIGSLPHERGVVATCSYEARRYGVHSAMNIKEAYRLCPEGVYIHPNFDKYRAVSAQLRGIWDTYASALETVALDEAYLDVTERAGSWENACAIARTIKRRTLEEMHLTCSVGIAYCKTAAKIASEEKKPDGYFEIRTAHDFVSLIIDRDVGVLYTVGEKTAEKLHRAGIRTVRDVRERQREVIRLLGKQGEWITRIAFGIDGRQVTAWRPEDAKSISRELTFQEDVDDRDFLKEVLLLLSLSVERRAARYRLYGQGITLKVTFGNMKTVTRSRPVPSTRSAAVIWQETEAMLDTLPRQAVRLIGAGLHSLNGENGRQLHFDDFIPGFSENQNDLLRSGLQKMRQHYGLDFEENLERIHHGETLYRTVEYMRKHR